MQITAFCFYLHVTVFGECFCNWGFILIKNATKLCQSSHASNMRQILFTEGVTTATTQMSSRLTQHFYPAVYVCTVRFTIRLLQFHHLWLLLYKPEQREWIYLSVQTAETSQWLALSCRINRVQVGLASSPSACDVLYRVGAFLVLLTTQRTLAERRHMFNCTFIQHFIHFKYFTRLTVQKQQLAWHACVWLREEAMQAQQEDANSASLLFSYSSFLHSSETCLLG